MPRRARSSSTSATRPWPNPSSDLRSRPGPDGPRDRRVPEADRAVPELALCRGGQEAPRRVQRDPGRIRVPISDRDQDPTALAIEEFQKLIELYRNSRYAEEGKKLLDECNETLAESEFRSPIATRTRRPSRSKSSRS